MNHLKKIVILLRAVAVQIKQAFMELPLYQKIIAVVVVLAILFGLYKLVVKKPVEAVAEDMPKAVVVANVGDLSSNSAPVPLVGQVTSVNEATIRAESSGRLTRVYKKLGDRVSAGQIIAEFENSSERASVLQAQGQFESAKASRDIALINTANTGNSIGDNKTNTLNTINSTYSTLDDIVRSKTDISFVDPRTDYPKLKLSVPDAILQSKIESERKDIEKMLVERFAKNLTLTTDSDLLPEIAKVQSEVQMVKNYLDDLGSAYVKALPNNEFNQVGLDAQKGVIGGARTTLSGTISGLTSSKIALQNAIASQEIAGRTTGDKNPNTASVDAVVKTAEGGYLAALSRLEKTIIRSPISGTLNSLSIDTGDFVTQSSQVAVVGNNGALEVVSYVTSDDLSRVKAGASVKINGNIKGVVTRVAGAIDPVTKKIEVRVGIVDENSQLVNGQSVRVEISQADITSQSPKSLVAMIKIPLSAVKITPRDSYVFTLSASSTLQVVPVELGTLLGEEVEIRSGLTPDMDIVKDARGLKEGEKVATN